MDPISGTLIAAGISGLANLAGGLFGLKAEAKKRERDSKMEGLKAQLEAGNQAAQTLQQGSQGAFNQLMQGYQGVFRR
jgi:hypothetical protein